MTAQLLAAISWDPGFRGVLVVAVGIGVLCGSTYLLLATNTGHRLGFLLAFTGLFGWLTIMGLVWTMYGIGYKGPTPTWKVKEVNVGDLRQAGVTVARRLPEPKDLPKPEDILRSEPALRKAFPPGAKTPTLGDLVTADKNLADTLNKRAHPWRLLPTSDKANGETQAVVATHLGPEGTNQFAATTDYVIIETFTTGGKPGRTDSSVVGRITHKLRTATMLQNPPAYAVVQLQAAIPQEARPGQAPPVPVADPKAPVMSVIMERDLGALRLPSFGVTVFCGAVFAICANMLHRRDQHVSRARASVAGAT